MFGSERDSADLAARLDGEGQGDPHRLALEQAVAGERRLGRQPWMETWFRRTTARTSAGCSSGPGVVVVGVGLLTETSTVVGDAVAQPTIPASAQAVRRTPQREKVEAVFELESKAHAPQSTSASADEVKLLRPRAAARQSGDQPRLQDDLHAALFLVHEHVVARGASSSGSWWVMTKLGSISPALDALEQRLHVALHVALARLDRERRGS